MVLRRKYTVMGVGRVHRGIEPLRGRTGVTAARCCTHTPVTDSSEAPIAGVLPNSGKAVQTVSVVGEGPGSPQAYCSNLPGLDLQRYHLSAVRT